MSTAGPEPHARARDALPVVTVIMPVRREEAFIERSLGAVLAQDYPPERMQVLVADGMSEDRTRELVETLARAHPRHQVEIVDNPGRIVPTGFNAALERARGDVIVRVDGHTVVAPDYVRQCVTALAESGAENVGGPIETVSSGAVGEAIAVAISSRFGVGNSHFRASTDTAWVDTVPFGAWPREVFARLGPFDPELVRNQDDEFNYRIRENGGRILLSSRIRSRYHSRSSLRRLARQYFQYGLWKVRVMQKHPRQMSPRQFVPPLFFGALVLKGALSQHLTLARWGWLVLIALYLAANLAASVVTARRRGWRHLPLLPLCYPIVHMSFGAGFLVGLVRFAGRWRDRGEAPAAPAPAAQPSGAAGPWGPGAARRAPPALKRSTARSRTWR